MINTDKRGIRTGKVNKGKKCRCDVCDVYIRDYRDEWWCSEGKEGPFCKPCYDELKQQGDIE